MKFSFYRFLILSVVATLFIPQVHAQVVDIPDPNLRQAIRETLQLPVNTPITQQDMLQLTELWAASSSITNLTGLEYATNLDYLNVGDNQISDIRPVAGLINLTGLALWKNQIQDITPIANLTNLQRLALSENTIDNLEPLRGLTQLQVIDLYFNRVKDLAPLANLTNLTELILTRNQVSDLTPLANLIALETLWLESNEITDITPLTRLKNLKRLYLADNPIYDFSPLLEFEEVELDIEIDLSRLDELNVVVEIPDLNLEQAIREELSLPEGVPLTQGLMLGLMGLRALDSGITDLTGIEYATNLEYLSLGGNQIRDIRPLMSLINLTSLSLFNNEVQDIAPLADLTNLTGLNLGLNSIENLEPLTDLIRLEGLGLLDNRVKDITPLSNLTALTRLILSYNQVSDLAPLVNLLNLQIFWINDNPVADFTPLQGLNLIEFYYDEVCDIPPLPPLVRDRIENRSFPSVFQAWDDVVGQDYLTWDQRTALHDLHWSPFFGLHWDVTETEPTYGIATSLAGVHAEAHEVRQRRLAHNPNMVFLIGVRLHNHFTPEAFPPDSDFWLRDAQGQIVPNDFNEYLINFLKPEVQDLLVKRIIAVEQCGLYDGVFIDGFLGNGTGFVGRQFYSATDEEIMIATENIIRAVRSQVRDDFLIVVNANDTKPTRYAEYINGTFLETSKDYPGGYTYERLRTLESVLLWSEENLRPPQITCLEGQGMTIEPPDGPNNRRWMRVFTTMSLTHSDGYVIYTTGRSGHQHLWHSFWDADLGRPVDKKAQQYQNIPGTFIREFTNGWAVYNRSGSEQEISLPAPATPVSNRGGISASMTHLLPDLDGEIYLKTRNPADVNGDWVVNILDLVQVANGFGKSTPDPNGDGTVNILDLVFVAQQFKQ